MYKSDICDTKISHMSETKQFKVSIETRVYGLSIGDKSGDLSVNFGLLFWGAIFPQRISGTLFVGAQRNLASLRVWPTDTYSLNFVNFGPGVP